MNIATAVPPAPSDILAGYAIPAYIACFNLSW